MSKICKNCGEAIDDNATYCFKCKHNPDVLSTPETEKKAADSVKKQKTVKTIVSVAVIAALIVCVFLIVRGCTDIHRKVKLGEGSVKLTDVVQEGTTVKLIFETGGKLKMDDVREFCNKIKVDDCKLDGVSYSVSGWSSGGATGSIDGLEVSFTAPDTDYKISDGKIHF